MFKTFMTIPLSIFTLVISNQASAENVEIFLSDRLDNQQSGYCIDIARAQGAEANPDDGLQGHTCYSPSGELVVDQIFDSSRFAEGVLYMPEFDVCAEISSINAGTLVSLAACDGGKAQSFQFSGEGAIAFGPAPEMCLTLAEDTRTGRSDTNQIKVMSLEICSNSKRAFQTWAVRSLSE